MHRRTPNIKLFESVQMNANLLSGSKLNMIQVLFDGLSAALLAAQGHGINQATERKLRALSRAQRIIKGLQLTLDKEKELLLSTNLEDLYRYMGTRLWHASALHDTEAITEVLWLTRTLSDAWSKLSQPMSQQYEVKLSPIKDGRLSRSYLA
jgi:flagellar protein FliS